MATAPMTVRICYLYPRLLSVAGDRGNLLALIRRCSWRGIRYSVTEADVIRRTGRRYRDWECSTRSQKAVEPASSGMWR